jgi:DNA-binding MarR family transcriptional regulator
MTQQQGRMGRDERFDVERSIRYRVALLSRLWTVSTERIYLDQFGMTLSEWRILAIVAAAQPVYANAIVERGILEKSRVSRIVARLVERQLLETSPDDEDSRRNLLQLTAEGARMHDALAELSRKRDELFERALTKREQAEFDRMVCKLLNWSFTVTGQ